MKIYSISYDLRQPGRNYSNLYDRIKLLDSSCQHPLESNWFIRSNESAEKIYDFLRPYIDDNDLLFVTEINSQNKQGWMVRTFWNWINQSMK